MRFLFGMVFGFFVMGAVAVFVIVSGAVSAGATEPISKAERTIAKIALDRSVARRAPKTTSPVKATPETLAKAMPHYKTMCLTCHGAGAVDPSAIGEGLNPPAPDLSQPSVQGRTDGELFWLIQNGIRMTGMPAFGPTHKDDDIWALVAFLRHLPELTEAEEAALEAP